MTKETVAMERRMLESQRAEPAHYVAPRRTEFNICKHCGADLEPLECEPAPQIERLMAEREQLVAALRAFGALADNCLCDDAYDMRNGMEAIRADASALLRQIEGADRV